MRIKKRLGKRRIIRHAQQLGLPEDVAFGLPRLVLHGNTSLTLENHHGALEYGPTMVRMRTTLGAVCIEGEGISMSRMGRHDLMLRGEIKSVNFERVPFDKNQKDAPKEAHRDDAKGAAKEPSRDAARKTDGVKPKG